MRINKRYQLFYLLVIFSLYFVCALPTPPGLPTIINGENNVVENISDQAGETGLSINQVTLATVAFVVLFLLIIFFMIRSIVVRKHLLTKSTEKKDEE